MENHDLHILRKLRDWRISGKKALLATVIRTWGSSPRPIGSIMALCESGAVVGSVSGGCIEDELVRCYANPEMPQVPPQLVQFGLTADEAHRLGLPCGGTLELLLEFNPEQCALDNLVLALEQGRVMKRILNLKTVQVALEPVVPPSQLTINDTHLTNSFGPQYRMLLIGAGQLAEYLATMALFNDFAVTVCDPRAELFEDWTLTGVTLDRRWPDDAIQAFEPDCRSCVITLTHDPKLDDAALLEALETDAFYIGAIGSTRTNEQRRSRMTQHFGVRGDTLSCLRGPVGLYIDSKTPAEIAVSIMAEVIATKNGVTVPNEMNIALAKNRRPQPPRCTASS